MIKIIPAILATTQEDYQAALKRLEDSNVFDWVQIDLMDNKFVQNKSIGPEILVKYPTNLKLEAHLMVEYPENWIDDLVKLDIKRIIFPVEDSEGVLERIKHIKNHGKQAGLSINPETPLEIVEPYLDIVDVVLVMSVHPGFQGQEFIPASVNKIRELSILINQKKLKVLIEVDGGINEDNIKSVKDAGVDITVVGSGLSKYDNLKDGLQKLESVL